MSLTFYHLPHLSLVFPYTLTFISNPHRHASSHHLLYLQLRRDILEERVIVDPDHLFKLAGLALQAEYGDFSKEKSSPAEGQFEGAPSTTYFDAEHYVPVRVLKQTGASMTYTKVTRRHKAAAGVSRAQAEFEFVKVGAVIIYLLSSKTKRKMIKCSKDLIRINMEILSPITKKFLWNWYYIFVEFLRRHGYICTVLCFHNKVHFFFAQHLY